MKYLILFCVFFLSLNGSAQDYSGQYPGATHFYTVNNSNIITGIYPDSSYFVGGETIYVPVLLFRNVVNENIVDSSCMFWGSQECQLKKDKPTLLGKKIIKGSNYVKYFNSNNDSITINFGVSVSDTQTVFQNSSNLIKYHCISKDTTTLFNVFDSIIKFTVIHYDSLGNLTSSIVQGDTIIYSKNTGLIKGYALHFFPDSLEKISLEGIRNPNYGFSGLTEADFYDFQVGDKYETYKYGTTPFLRDFYEVLSRTDNGNSITYTLNNIHGTTGSQYPPINYTYTTSTVSATYSKVFYLDAGFPDETGQYVKNVSLYNNCWQGMTFIYSSSDWCQPGYCESADCYGSGDCYGSWNYDGLFAQGLGKVSEHSIHNIWGQPQSWFSVTYFDIQGLECGSSYILSSEEIKNEIQFMIYPNPASGSVTVHCDYQKAGGKIIISDFSGRIIRENTIYSNTTTINTENLADGIYFIGLSIENKIISQQKLVIVK